jgi:hypothetical protein
MEDIILFQNERIAALENEIQRLKLAVIRKENSLQAYLKRLTELKNDPVFNQPIQTKNYSNESNATMA